MGPHVAVYGESAKLVWKFRVAQVSARSLAFSGNSPPARQIRLSMRPDPPRERQAAAAPSGTVECDRVLRGYPGERVARSRGLSLGASSSFAHSRTRKRREAGLESRSASLSSVYSSHFRSDGLPCARPSPVDRWRAAVVLPC